MNNILDVRQIDANAHVFTCNKDLTFFLRKHMICAGIVFLEDICFKANRFGQTGGHLFAFGKDQSTFVAANQTCYDLASDTNHFINRRYIAEIIGYVIFFKCNRRDNILLRNVQLFLNILYDGIIRRSSKSKETDSTQEGI